MPLNVSSAGVGRTGTLISLYSIIEGINYQLKNRGALHLPGDYPD